MFHQDSHPSMVFASFDGEKEEVFNWYEKVYFFIFRV
jgi:hypothetical protein